MMRNILRRVIRSNNLVVQELMKQRMIFPKTKNEMTGEFEKSEETIRAILVDLNRGVTVNLDTSYFNYDKKPSSEKSQLEAGIEQYLSEQLGENNFPDVYKFWCQDLDGFLYGTAKTPSDPSGEFYMTLAERGKSSQADLYRDLKGRVFVTSQVYGLVLIMIPPSEDEPPIEIPGVMQTTFMLVPGQGYKLVEAKVSNSLLERLCTSDHFLTRGEIEDGMRKAEKEEQGNIKELAELKISQKDMEIFQNIGIKDLGNLFKKLYGGDLESIGKNTLRVRHQTDATVYSVISKKIDPKNLIYFCVTPADDEGRVKTFSRVTFYIQKTDNFQPGDCVLSDTQTYTMAAGVELLKRISEQVDISALPVEMKGDELSPKALAWLTCQAKDVIPCQDQDGTPVTLADLVVPERGNRLKVQQAMEQWVAKMPVETERQHLETALRELIIAGQPTLRMHA